jgi:hypothetical protein
MKSMTTFVVLEIKINFIRVWLYFSAHPIMFRSADWLYIIQVEDRDDHTSQSLLQ